MLTILWCTFVLVVTYLIVLKIDTGSFIGVPSTHFNHNYSKTKNKEERLRSVSGLFQSSLNNKKKGPSV